MKIYLKIALFALLILMPGMTMAQADRSIVVQGTVIDDLFGDPMIAVNVSEVNSANRVVGGAITDFNGKFVIRAKDPKNKLVISYIGYKQQIVEIGNKRTFNITLIEDAKLLGEAVVTAQRRHAENGFSIPEREIASAVQKLDTKEFEGIQVTSVDDALQGRIAGLDIVSNSGDLGSGTQMRIRGTSSINSNSEPLIVVNGIPYEQEIDSDFDFANANQEQYASMLSINPDDILAISVSKDAGASGIWGSKGANGVIEITTKRGAKGPTKITYAYRFSMMEMPKGMKMLNGDDYTMLMKQAYFNPAQDENALGNVWEYDYDQNNPNGNWQNFNNNTDWVKAVTQNGFTHDNNFSISGGGERASFRVSAGYLTQSGTIIEQKLNRITTRAVLDYRVSDRMKFSSEFAYTYQDNHRSYEDLLGISYKKMPNASIYDQDRNGNDTENFFNIPATSSIHNDQKNLRNPVAVAKLATNRQQLYRIIPVFSLQYDFLDPEKHKLQYNGYVNFDINNTKTNKFLPHQVSNIAWNNSGVNRADDSDSESLNIRTDNNINFTPKFANEDHSLVLYGSWQLTTGNSNAQGLTTFGLPSGEIVDPSALGYLEGISSSRSNWRSMALLARFHYAYKGKYILSGNVRRDGSTRFGKGRKWGTFPTLSAKWIISDEEFMESSKSWLSMLAVRPSWGITGNQPNAEYLHFSRYAVDGSYIDMTAIKPVNLQLSDLRWEKNISFNAGVDLGLFNNRLVFDANYYYRRTEDLLFANVEISSTSGFGTLSYLNAGTMENKGWELNVNGNDVIKTKNFALDLRFNIADNRNVITELDDRIVATKQGEFNKKNGQFLERFQVGHPFGSIYGFRYLGVYQYDKYDEDKGHLNAPVARDASGAVIKDSKGEPLPMMFCYNDESIRYKFRGGDAIYEDVNNDGSIDELDMVYLGNSNPKFNGGFSATMRYKKLYMTAFFNFRYGNKIINSARMYAENMYGNDNQSVAVNWRWRKDGDVTEIPRALYNEGYNWLGSDRYVEDGSFLRFKYLVFGYTMPKDWLKAYGIQGVRLNLTFNNLFVFTKYTGLDPEISVNTTGLSYDNAKTPRSRDFTIGATIDF